MIPTQARFPSDWAQRKKKWNHEKKKTERGTNNEPAVSPNSQTNTHTFRLFCSPNDPNGMKKKNCTQTHTKTQCHKKIGRIKTKTSPYIYISDGREHLHNSIEYPNFFLYLFLVLCARAELKWAKQSSDFLAQLWFDIDCTRTCASL